MYKMYDVTSNLSDLLKKNKMADTNNDYEKTVSRIHAGLI